MRGGGEGEGGSRQEKEADKEKARYYCWCAPFSFFSFFQNFNYNRGCIDVSTCPQSFIKGRETLKTCEREREREC